jgi:solute carrier family 36 (proton-coupled amino acid transporter)
VYHGTSFSNHGHLVYFLASQLLSIVTNAFHLELTENERWYILPIIFIIFYPFVLVRKI